MCTLNELLEKTGLSQYRLAKMIGCAPQTICRIANGQRNLTVEMAGNIARATKASATIQNGQVLFKLSKRSPKAGAA